MHCNCCLMFINHNSCISIAIVDLDNTVVTGHMLYAIICKQMQLKWLTNVEIACLKFSNRAETGKYINLLEDNSVYGI